MYETKPYFYGTGRRKDSVARVRVYTGTGKITINDRDIDNYFGLETLKLIVRSPLVLLGLEGKYDVVVRVSGGGVSGQAGAMYETKPYFYGTGRRKDSVARVRVYQGTGKVTINDRDIDNYFGLETLKLIVRSPLVLLGLEGKYDVVVRVSGGGVSGQAGAIRHGLSRALLQQSDENRAVLKKAGFLTRDPRMKERKKYGLKAARRAPQFSKR